MGEVRVNRRTFPVGYTDKQPGSGMISSSVEGPDFSAADVYYN